MPTQKQPINFSLRVALEVEEDIQLLSIVEERVVQSKKVISHKDAWTDVH